MSIEATINYYRDYDNDGTGKRHFEIIGDGIHSLLTGKTKLKILAPDQKILFNDYALLRVENNYMTIQAGLGNRPASRAGLFCKPNEDAYFGAVDTLSGPSRIGLSTVLRSILTHVFFQKDMGDEVHGVIDSDNYASLRARWLMSNPVTNQHWHTSHTIRKPKYDFDREKIAVVTRKGKFTDRTVIENELIWLKAAAEHSY